MQHSTKNSKIELPCRKNGLRQTQHSPPRPQNKKPPHRVNAHLPLGLYVDAKKNVLVLAHLARNSRRIWPYSLQDLNIALQVAQYACTGPR